MKIDKTRRATLTKPRRVVRATTAVAQLGDEHRELGFSELVLTNAAQSWRQLPPIALSNNRLILDGDLDENRILRWQALNEGSDRESALGFLIAVMGSQLERESAAAAAALWRSLRQAPLGTLPPVGPDSVEYERLSVFGGILNPLWPSSIDQWGASYPRLSLRPALRWDPRQWRNTFDVLTSRLVSAPTLDAAVVAAIARARLDAAHRSYDPVTRSLASAADWLPPETGASPTPPVPPSAPRQTAVLPGVSTMIHGTWGWKGDWWRSGSQFHEFIKLSYRPSLYSGGARLRCASSYCSAHLQQAM